MTLPDCNVKVYFCVTLFIGDNLALNTILGFQKSFVSNHFWRFCKFTHLETQYAVNESLHL